MVTTIGVVGPSDLVNSSSRIIGTLGGASAITFGVSVSRRYRNGTTSTPRSAYWPTGSLATSTLERRPEHGPPS